MANVKVDLDHALAVATDLALQAGEQLLKRARERITPSGAQLTVVQKINAVDLCTEADEDAEKIILEGLRKNFPDHAFVGEESYGKGVPNNEYLVGDGPTWVVDPLDGTVNYVHLFPTVCVSIGLCVGGIPVVGVIYAPFFGAVYPPDGAAPSSPSGHLFTAIKDKGAFVSYDGGKSRRSLPLQSPAPPIPEAAPKGCTLAVEFGKDRKDVPGGNLERKMTSFWNLAGELGGRGGKGGMVHGVRCLGSATLDLAFVATGAIDIFWEGGCWEWDVCAGICILVEAGGIVVDCNPPENFDPSGTSTPTSPIPQAPLGGRRYLAIRPCSQTPDSTETAREAQDRLVREVWKRVEGVSYSRPGL